MPVAVTITVSNLGAILLLLLVLALGFVLGKTSGKQNQPVIPSKIDLEAMTDTLKAWMDIGDTVAGWKAAVYGAVGVVIGALGGLAAEFVTKGDISFAEAKRIGIVLIVLILAMVMVVVVVEKFRVVEKLIKKR